MFIDVHCHIEDFEDVKEVVLRAQNSGVKIIINNGLNKESNRKTLKLSKKFDCVKASLGLFPSDVIEMSDDDLKNELNWISRQDLFCIGEIGLDGTYDNLEKQEKWFRELLKLAVKLDKVVIVHTRRAEQRVIEILEEMKVKKVILHCFSGNFKLVDRIVKNKWHFSIPTNVVFSKHFQELVLKVPFSLLLTETDSPYLGPIKGKRNEPMNIVKGIEKIAELKGITKEECEKMIFMNFQRLF